MNCLLLFPSELVSSNKAIVNGQRAAGLIETHELKQGINIRVSLFETGLGSGQIKALSQDKIEVTLELDRQPPPREKIHLIAAVARPQTIKKILHTSASHGIKKISFIISENSQKSYLKSKALIKENILSEMYLAIEQSVDCFLPEVKTYETYYEFIREIKADEHLAESLKVIADAPRAGDSMKPGAGFKLAEKAQQVILAIGPEAGWSDNERRDFQNLGFNSYSLGARIYRAETALAMLFGQLINARVAFS